MVTFITYQRNQKTREIDALSLKKFPTISEALKYVEEKPNVGYRWEIDEYLIDGNLEEFKDNVFVGELNKGKELKDDGIIITYLHHMHLNYAYEIEDICHVRNTGFEYESDLLTTPKTFHPNFKYYESLEEFKEAIQKKYMPFDKLYRGYSVITEFLDQLEQ